MFLLYPQASLKWRWTHFIEFIPIYKIDIFCRNIALSSGFSSTDGSIVAITLGILWTFSDFRLSTPGWQSLSCPIIKFRFHNENICGRLQPRREFCLTKWKPQLFQAYYQTFLMMNIMLQTLPVPIHFKHTLASKQFIALTTKLNELFTCIPIGFDFKMVDEHERMRYQRARLACPVLVWPISILIFGFCFWFHLFLF